MSLIQRYQENALKQAQRRNAGPFAPEVERVFFAVPRHAFVGRYRSKDSPWLDVNKDNLEEHLAALYDDRPLALWGEEADFESLRENPVQTSTISQPFIVLKMIELLQLRPGHTVFEVGCGSGWNAALMAEMVGEQGRVVSTEIIKPIAEQARQRLAAMGFAERVEVRLSDASLGAKDAAPFDRIIFTAGANDIPTPLIEQLKPGGIMLFVMNTDLGSDMLLVLEKRADHLAALSKEPCGFVPMISEHLPPGEALPKLSAVLEERGISADPVTLRAPFWWGGLREERLFQWFMSFTLGYFAVAEPAALPLQVDTHPGLSSFAVPSSTGTGLAVALPDRLEQYGTGDALQRLKGVLQRWLDQGMPTISAMNLEIWPRANQDTLPAPRNGQWCVTRKHTELRWSLQEKG